MKIKTLVACLLLSAYLGIHNGQLALFCSNDPEPAVTYPISVQMLPPDDQRALSAGIRIRDHLHLAQLLEDYLS